MHFFFATRQIEGLRPESGTSGVFFSRVGTDRMEFEIERKYSYNMHQLLFMVVPLSGVDPKTKCLCMIKVGLTVIRQWMYNMYLYLTQ